MRQVRGFRRVHLFPHAVCGHCNVQSFFLRLLLLVVKRGYLFQSTPIFVIIVREWRRCFGQTGTNVLQKEEHKKLLNKLNHLIAEENIEIKIKKNVHHISCIYFLSCRTSFFTCHGCKILHMFIIHLTAHDSRQRWSIWPSLSILIFALALLPYLHFLVCLIIVLLLSLSYTSGLWCFWETIKSRIVENFIKHNANYSPMQSSWWAQVFWAKTSKTLFWFIWFLFRTI